MSIRIGLARWLAPEWTQQHKEQAAQIHALRENLRRSGWEKAAARTALNAIISRANTKSPNSTVKAIARMAEEALKG